jgi:hypothetical protein
VQIRVGETYVHFLSKMLFGKLCPVRVHSIDRDKVIMFYITSEINTFSISVDSFNNDYKPISSLEIELN